MTGASEAQVRGALRAFLRWSPIRPTVPFMKQLKLAIAGAGLVGIIATFLPMVEPLGMSISLWDTRNDDFTRFMLIMLGYLVGLGVGVFAIVKPPLKRAFAGPALACFALSAYKMRSPGFDGAIGSKLLFISAIVGAIVCIAAIVKPEQE